jgi:SnoaL-like domain
MQSSVRRDASTSEADPLRAVRDRTSDPRYFNSGKLNVALLAAKTRSLAYWKDECDRDLDRLLAHFTSDASVVTPNGIYSEGGAIRGLYRNSFEEYPALSVDVIDVFPGADACCIEYSAVLTDVSSRRFLVEGVNLMRMRDGWISYLRSFEDAPRPIPVGRSAPQGREEAESTSGGERI